MFIIYKIIIFSIIISITSSPRICHFSSLLRDIVHMFQDYPGGPAGKESACNAGEPCSIPGLGRSPGKGKDCALPVFWPGESHGWYRLTLLMFHDTWNAVVPQVLNMAGSVTSFKFEFKCHLINALPTVSSQVSLGKKLTGSVWAHISALPLLTLDSSLVLFGPHSLICREQMTTVPTSYITKINESWLWHCSVNVQFMLVFFIALHNLQLLFGWLGLFHFIGLVL